jgi:hypothetical protein
VKADMISWLQRQGVACDATMMKHLLYKLIKLKMPKENSCRIEHILNMCDHIALAVAMSVPLNLPELK